MTVKSAFTTENSGLGLGFLGPVRIVVDGRPVSGVPRKPLALLGYLARHAGDGIDRETLAGLLWGDSGEEQARASLRQSLSALRRGLGPAFEQAIRTDQSRITLDPASARIDLAAFAEAARSDDGAALAGAVELYRGEFLEGIGGVAPAFDRWLEAERGALRSAFCDLGLRHADAAWEAGRIEESIAAHRRLLVVDPLQEHVHRRLIRALAAQRRHDAALRQFTELRDLLQSELGVEPEAPTLALVREVQGARRSGGASDPAPSRPPAEERPAPTARPSIAVLPFRALSGSEEATLFAEGAAEDVIIELSRDPALFVVARHSSFRFAEDRDAPADIGAALGVRYLVSGTVRMAGDRVRVAVHLVDCSNGAELWSERYDRDLSDVFEIQSDIARTVTATVVGRISEAAFTEIRDRPADSLEAIALIQLGTRRMNEVTPDDMAEAVRCFGRAVELAPDNARALGLYALATIYDRWYFQISADVADAVPYAERAIRADPRDARAHLALGIAEMIGRRWDSAGHHFQAALTANPNDDLVLCEYGRYLMYTERPEDGVRRIREAMRLNPYHANWYWNLYGRCLHTAGRLEEARDAFLRVTGAPFYVHVYLAACHHALGETEAAAAARGRVYELNPSFNLTEFFKIFPYRDPEIAKRYFATLSDAGFRVDPL